MNPKSLRPIGDALQFVTHDPIYQYERDYYKDNEVDHVSTAAWDQNMHSAIELKDFNKIMLYH